MQLRDDLLSMLVAGHETTGSVLTWTLYLLSKVLLQSLCFSLQCFPILLVKKCYFFFNLKYSMKCRTGS